MWNTRKRIQPKKVEKTPTRYVKVPGDSKLWIEVKEGISDLEAIEAYLVKLSLKSMTQKVKYVPVKR